MSINHSDAAEELTKFIIERRKDLGFNRATYRDNLKAKLDELFPIPKDLEATVETATFRLYGQISLADHALVRANIVSAVAPLIGNLRADLDMLNDVIAERDKRIEELEGKTREWHDILVHQVEVLSQPIPLDIKPDEEAAREAAQSLESPDED